MGTTLNIEDVFSGVGPASDAVRLAAERTAADAGGGATTAVTLTLALLDEGLRRLKAGVATPEELARGMRKAIAAILEALSAQSHTIDDRGRLARIAAVREDVEPSLADMLAEALTSVPAGAVRIVVRPDEETRIEFLPIAAPVPRSAMIVVGGADAERRARDVQRAVQVAHAIDREGAVLGGGVAYLRASTALDGLALEGAEAAGVDSVRKALGMPALRIARASGVKDPAGLVRRIRRRADEYRGYNLKTGQFENLLDAGVLDPTLVARAAIKRAGEAASTAILESSKVRDVEEPPPHGPAQAAGEAGPTPSAGSSVVRYTKVTCPRKVSVRAPQPFSVLVGLTLAPGSDASMAALVEVSAPVGVHLTTSAGLDVVGEPSAELTVLADRDSEPASFRVHASAPGSHTLRVIYSQLGHPVAEVALTVEAADREVDDEAVSVSTPMLAPGDAEPPDLLLYITYSNSSLTFELERRNGQRTSFPPVDLESDLKEFMRVQYERLDQLRATAVDTIALEARGTVRRLAAEDVDDRIANLGAVLWNDLVPRGLRALYAGERSEWRDKTLVILSDEPFVPWELVKPWDDERGSWDDGQPWCESLMLTRWLRPEPDTTALAGTPPPELPLAHMSIVAPKPPADQPLPAAGKEEQFLADFRAAHGVADAGVVPATKKNVMETLRAGAYDWLHAVTHGTVESTPTGYAPLWLDDNASIVPEDFLEPLVVKALVEHRPAFVLNACELGRGSWSLRGTSGWAKRLVGKGAGLLIAPLWTVTDELAVTFVTVLYEQLAVRAPLARAVREARRKTRKPGDPTWLAYSVYGHPNATLRTRAPHG